MRIFQNSSLYPTYRKRLVALTRDIGRYEASMDVFFADRYGAQHMLLPVLTRDKAAMYVNGDDWYTQKMWAAEHGLSKRTPLEDILLAQIESHKPDVFYNQDPVLYGSRFLKRLPGCVKRKIAWRAAPSPGADFGGYDLMVCNFPSILEEYRRSGLKAEYFYPAYDPVMQTYADNDHRPIDVLFIGGYTRHHLRRVELLKAMASLTDIRVALHLDNSRMTNLAESFLGKVLFLGKHRRPKEIREITQQPVFGVDLYRVLASSKIVLNGAIDMAGNDRGNLRCFEAMGCRALLLSDAGNYPEDMEDGRTLITYASAHDAVNKMRSLLQDTQALNRVANDGHEMVKSRYSKQRQWQRFMELV